MARCRLRFLLQEIDLHDGDTLIGRSADCHVTIEDPLVSRNHARIRIARDLAVVEDLDSRNGTFVNGRAVEGLVGLEDGDRVRIGTLELVFCRAPERAQPQRPGRRTTGFMCHCAACGTPYPAESQACPHCGSNSRIDDDTISGIVGEADRNWTLDLLVEVLGKARAVKRWNDVARMLSRARANIEARLASDQAVTPEHLDQVAEAAVELSAHLGDPEWATWVLNIHATLRRVPAEGALQPLDLMPEEARRALTVPAERLLEAVAGGGSGTLPSASLVRIRALCARG